MSKERLISVAQEHGFTFLGVKPHNKFNTFEFARDVGDRGQYVSIRTDIPERTMIEVFLREAESVK